MAFEALDLARGVADADGAWPSGRRLVRAATAILLKAQTIGGHGNNASSRDIAHSWPY